MLILKRIPIWFLETACEALLLGGVLLAFAARYSTDPSRDGFARYLAFTTLATVEVFMWHCGYILTTAIVGILFRSRRLWFYPAVASLLFLAHLQYLLGKTMWDPREKLTVRVAGVCIVSCCTFFGNCVLRKWSVGRASVTL